MASSAASSHRDEREEGRTKGGEARVGRPRPRLAGLMKLVDITRRLAAETELDPILKIIVEGSCEAVECERASIFLYDAQHNELYSRVAIDLEVQEIRTSLDTGINGWVARHRRLLNVSNPRTDSRWNPQVDQQTGFHTRNILAAPLISPDGERLLGTLELLNKVSGNAFDRADENLLHAFAAHAAVSLERVELLDQARKTQELAADLETARRVQSRFLPQRLPDLPGYAMAAWWQPALGVGGDYYDVIPMRDGRVALAVADVSGHGLGPSLIMASARAMLHVLLRTQSDPASVLSLLNQTIQPDLGGRFITFMLAALDPAAHVIEYANAGHGPALQLERATGRVHSLGATCLPIGILTGSLPEPTRKRPIAPGDLFVLATDGAVEQRDAGQQMFGRERLERLVRDHQALPAKELLEVIKRGVKEFFTGEFPDDDVTVLVVERKQQAGP
jgi:serine phosphatase RsbU (regulator of sigma subunit)